MVDNDSESLLTSKGYLWLIMAKTWNSTGRCKFNVWCFEVSHHQPTKIYELIILWFISVASTNWTIPWFSPWISPFSTGISRWSSWLSMVSPGCRAAPGHLQVHGELPTCAAGHGGGAEPTEDQRDRGATQSEAPRPNGPTVEKNGNQTCLIYEMIWVTSSGS